MSMMSVANNLSALNTQKNLYGTNANISGSLQRLSSGYRINQGKDGPADLVISELLRAQKSGIDRAIRNSTETMNVLSIAEGALVEMNEILKKMKQLALHAANGTTSSDQIRADQAEVDSGIKTIDRIANTTRYGNQQLLNGSIGLVHGTPTLISLGSIEFIDLRYTRFDEIFAKDANGGPTSISVSYIDDHNDLAVNSAKKAYFEDDTIITGPTDDILAIDGIQRFILTGNIGSFAFDFAVGTTGQEIADAINAVKGSTGVEAAAIADGLRIFSSEYGSDQFVRVQSIEGNMFGVAEGTTLQENGHDVVLNINGSSVQGKGLVVNVANNVVSAEFTLIAGTATTGWVAVVGYEDASTSVGDMDPMTVTWAGNITEVFSDFKAGLQLQIGDQANIQDRTVISIQSMAATNLGKVTIDGVKYNLNDVLAGKDASLDVNAKNAIAIVEQAIKDVSNLRARLGAVQSNLLQTNINSLRVAYENITKTEAYIRDTDYASETTEFAKNTIMLQAGTAMLAQANMQAQVVLTLLG